MRVAFLLAAALNALAQSPTFEVASIKPYKIPEGNGPRRVGCTGGPETKDPTRFSCEGLSVHNFILTAYDLKTYQLSGIAPFDGARYNLNAKIADGATKEQFRQMLQHLLAERFGLKLHREQKELPAYELVVAKGGPKFRESRPEEPGAADPSAPPPFKVGKDGYPELPPGRPGMMMFNGNATRRAVRETMTQFAAALSNQVGRPVVDATGLTGKYDVVLKWSTRAPVAPPPPGPEPGAPAAVDPQGPTIFSAIQEQLGLRLESKKGTFEMLVVDQVAKRPTEN